MLAAAALWLQVASAGKDASSRPTSPAVATKPQRVYEGLWFDIFEGQRFVPEGGDPRMVDLREDGIWLAIDRTRVLRALIDARAPGALLPDPYVPTVYHVRFVGREAQDMSCRRRSLQVNPCYGHMGSFPGLVVVDRIIAIEDLGPVPRFSSDNQH